jgi:hypothetical protein
MKEVLWSEAQRFAIDELIKHTALATLTSAAALPMGLLEAARKLDNPWAMATAHSEQAGQLLASVLASRPQVRSVLHGMPRFRWVGLTPS